MKKQIKENIEYTLSTFAIEHLVPSKDAIHLCEENAKGNISVEAAIQEIKDKYRI